MIGSDRGFLHPFGGKIDPHMGRYEILEHTADVGIRAFGASLSEVFEQAALGLLDITGAWDPRDASKAPMRVEQLSIEDEDIDALLVDWLEEVLYIQDARDAVITSMELRIDGTRLEGSLGWMPRGERGLEGTAVKAITYHQLGVERRPDGWVAQVFFDI